LPLIIYTIGHGRTGIKQFMDMLKNNRIDILVDVRSSPYSKRAPAYNLQMLEKVCRHEHIEYLWRGKLLGGFGEIPQDFFMKGVNELIEKSKEGIVVIMCSETDYTKCHRYYKITPELEKGGLEVTHLVVNKKKQGFTQASLI